MKGLHATSIGYKNKEEEAEKMGYVIPVQPIQSQMYANRMLMDEYNFAYISNVHGIKMKSLFEEKLAEKEKKYKQQDDSQEEEQVLELNESLHAPLYKNFIQPNPANLSALIAEVSGKGNNINLYI